MFPGIEQSATGSMPGMLWRVCLSNGGLAARARVYDGLRRQSYVIGKDNAPQQIPKESFGEELLGPTGR